MMYLVQCSRCNNKSLVEINTPADIKCGVCPAGPEDTEVVGPAHELMPTREEIARGLNFNL